MFSIILILGLLGMVTVYSMGGLIHIMLVIHNNGAGIRYVRAENPIAEVKTDS